MIEWPPIPLYIAFAVVATWSSVLGSELRREGIKPVEESGLSFLRKLLQWGGIGAAAHLLSYLFLACCKTLSIGNYFGLLSVVVHILVVSAVLVFMAVMFTVSFKRTQQHTVCRAGTPPPPST